MERKELDFMKLPKARTGEMWHYVSETYYTGHMYRNSPYETDDSCGNCDGARCDTCREAVREELHFRYSEDDVTELLNTYGIDDPKGYITCELFNCGRDEESGLKLIVPDEWSLYRDNKDLYNSLMTAGREGN